MQCWYIVIYIVIRCNTGNAFHAIGPETEFSASSWYD